MLPVRRQYHGTCWFHASMNGFLISVPGRTFLSKVIKDERITETPDVCPTRGASQRTLLSIASTYLKEGIRNNKRHLRNFTGNETKNLNTGGYIEDYYKIVGRLFRRYENLLSFSKPNTPGWTLSHAWIFLGTHAVTGAVRANGEYYIHDSNGNEYNIDWSKPGAIENIKDAFRKTKYKLYNVTIYPTYIKSDFLKNRNVQNTLQEAHEILNPAIKKTRNVLGNRYNQFLKNKKEFLSNKRLIGRLTLVNYTVENGLNEKILKLANQLASFRGIKNKKLSNEELNRVLPRSNTKFVIKLPVARPATKVPETRPHTVKVPRTPPRPVTKTPQLNVKNLTAKHAKEAKGIIHGNAVEKHLEELRKLLAPASSNRPKSPAPPNRPKSPAPPNRPKSPAPLNRPSSVTRTNIKKVETSVRSQIEEFLAKLKERH